MASGGAEEDNGGIPLDIDNVHMLLQVEHEQIQKRTFTNWINAQLSKRCPPSSVSDLFADLKDGLRLLDLLEVMSGESMKRQRGHGVFQHRANIETALSLLRKKKIKLVNINVSDVIDGRPSIILGLVWTIILRCHIEELASTLSFSSRHSSLDSVASLDSCSSSPVPGSPVPAGRTSPLHRRFKVSAKRALLMWVRDQCQRVGSSISVKDFKSSWRSGEAFLVILCSLRPQLVDLSLVQSRSNQENLEEAFHLAERELHIPRLLEPQDVDVRDPEEKSIMTYVAQFLQYSNDMPAPDDHLELFPLDQPSCFSPVSLPAHFTPAIAVSPLRQVSPSERAQEVTCWLQQAFDELSEARTATENSSYAEKYRVFQSLTGSFTEQRRPVLTLLATIGRRPELSQQHQALRAAWDHMEAELQRCNADLDLSLPPPLDSVVVWLQRAEAALTEEGGRVKDHADTAKAARAQQDTLKTLIQEMNRHVQILDNYENVDDSGNVVVPLEKFDDIKRRVTHIRVTAKYHGIKLEYQEHRLTVLDSLNRFNAKIQTWKPPYRSKEDVERLLQDWHDTVERQGELLILMDSLQNMKEKANTYTSKAALSEDSQLVNRQVKEAEREAESVVQAVPAARGTMQRVLSAWEIFNKCLTSLQIWLTQISQAQAESPAAGSQEMSEWAECQAMLNEVGNLLTEVTQPSTSRTLAEQLSKVNIQWAKHGKTKFEASSEAIAGPVARQLVDSLTQEANLLLRQPLEVASVPLKANRQKLQLLCKKMAEVESSLSSSLDIQTRQQTLLQTLVEAERACGELQRAASRLEGRLAELDHWSTDALDCDQRLKDNEHRGHPALESAAKALISRGLQLENQVLTEGRDLQDFVAGIRRTSPLQHLSTSGIQSRVSEAVSNCQEILRLFISLGYTVEPAHQTQIQPETGLLVVARTKLVDETGNVKLQTQDPSQPLTPSHTTQQRTRDLQGFPQNTHRNPQDERTIVKVKMLPPPLREPVTHFPSSPGQSVEEADPGPMKQTSSPSQRDQPSPSLTQTGPPPLALSKHVTSPLTEEKKSSTPPQSPKSKSRIRGQPKPPQVNTTSQKPPVVVRSEVHSRAQSMARSRLEKARVQLHMRIQQAIKLFGGKEISESQAKKKQRALKILHPIILNEFLDAVEGYGAFCSGAQLQDLMLLSDSVRKQWEDVRSEMAAFIPVLWSKLRERKQPFSVVQRESETHTNALHEATDQTNHGSLQQQVITDGAVSVEERAELLRELCDTVTSGQSSWLATEQLKEADEAQETSTMVLPADSRGRQFGGNTPLRSTGVSADAHQSSSLPQKQSADNQQQDLSPVAGSVPLHRDVLSLGLQDVPMERKDQLTQQRGSVPGKIKKSALRAQEQRLTARLLNVTESNQQAQAQIQAVVSGNTVETKQEAEWTVIPEAVTLPQVEQPSEQEVLERYRKSCSVFKSQLQKNEQHLQEFNPEPVTISTLQNQKERLQALKQETDALWLEVEPQYAQLSQSPHLMTRDDLSEVERDWKKLSQGWRGQQMCLQDRMTSLEKSADLMECADDMIALISQKLNSIIRQSVDISSFTLADPSLLPGLNEMDDRLQSEMRKITKQSSKEERQHPEATSLHQALHNRVSHLKQLRQQLEKVQLAAQTVDHFLATAREVKAEIPALLANQDESRQRNEAEWEQERHSWQAAIQQRVQTAADQCDSNLKTAGMSLTMDGAAVTCQDVVTLLSKHTVDVEEKLMRAQQRERKDEINLSGTEQMQRNEELNPVEKHQTNTGDDSLQQGGAQEKERPPPCGVEEEAKRRRVDGANDTKTQREEEHKAPTWQSEGDDKVQRRRSSQLKEGEGKESSVQRRAALLVALREVRGAAERLGLHELTLPALQQRTRALTELESRLAGLLSEFQHIQDACDVSQSSEVQDIWEETSKAVTERLEQCCVLTELLKRFQSVRGELTGTLHRAESTISEQVSYMGKDNLQRFHTKAQQRKAELHSLGDGIEELRSVCRQLHSHLRQIPECTIVPFESEADALMDSWLDISERTDSHLENLHLGLTLWDGVLQLGSEVESWTEKKLAVFAQTPSFQSEEDIKTLQNEIVAQEKSVERFHHRATEIQLLLQSTEPPLELQVAETQMRKKIEQLKELGSEAEDVYRQMEAAKRQITARMTECSNSLQKIQDSLLTLSGSDVATVLAKLKDICRQLQTQDEQAESLLEDLRVLTSIASPESLQTLCEDGIQLQERVRKAHVLFSEVEEQTQRSIQDLDRLQQESEDLDRWLQTTEEKAGKQQDLSPLQEEALKQRVRIELLSQLVSSLQSSCLQQCAPVEESSKLLHRAHNLLTNILHGAKETECSLREEVELFQALLKSTQSWLGDLRLIVDSPLGESSGIQSPVEQRLRHAQGVVSAAADGDARLEELGVTGNSLSRRLCDGDVLKQEIEETVQKTEEQWRDLVQSVEPYRRALQTDPEVSSSYLSRRQEVCCRVEELQCQTAQLPTSFPWPGTAERRQACYRAHQLWDESKSLHLTLSSLAEQRRDLAERTSDNIWNDSSWTALDTYCSSLMAELTDLCSCLEEGASNEEYLGHLLQECHHKLTALQERMSACQAQKENPDVPALEALLQEVTDMEKDILQLEKLKDSLSKSSTVEAQASVSQQVSIFQSHKRALDSSIKENLAQLTENNNQRVQHVKEEVSRVQTAVKDLAANVGELCENLEALPDISQLKPQWCAIQAFDTRLTELAARACSLQKTGESGITEEMLPADVILTVDGVAKDVDSLRSTFLQKKQQCAEIIANRVRHVIRQLQEWSQTVQAQRSSPNQAALDEGLQLQQSLHEVLSEKDFLLNCVGTKALKKLRRKASDALKQSTSAVESLSKHLVSRGDGEVEVKSKELMCEPAGETFRSDTAHSASPDKTDSLKLITATQDALVSNQISDVVKSKTEQESQQLTSQSNGHRTLSDTSDLPHDPNKQETPELLQEDTASVPGSAVGTDSTKYISSQQCVTSLATKPQDLPLSYTENVSETLKPITDAEGQEKPSEDISVTPNEAFTVVLEMQENLNTAATNVADVPTCSEEDEVASSTGVTEKKSGQQTTTTNPESDKTDIKSPNSASQPETSKPLTEKPCEDVNVSPKKVFTIVLDTDLPLFQSQEVEHRGNVGAFICPKAEDTDLENSFESNVSQASRSQKPLVLKIVQSTCAKLSSRYEAETHELMNPSTSCGSAAERQAAATTCPDAKHEETTGSRHTEEQTTSSVLCPVESSTDTGGALTTIDIPAGDNSQQVPGADAAESAGTGHEETTEGEGPESKCSDVPERRGNTSLQEEESESKTPAALEDTEETREQPQSEEDMEPERTVAGLSGVGETTGESPTSCKHRSSTMQDILSEIQTLVERSNIINRTPHIDLNWYLRCSPGEPEIRLVRTVQQVLACRYQPAQLDVAAMAKQLEEAEGYRCSVQEQVATMKSTSAARDCDPNALTRAEGQWSAALLDASATVQVKAAQLDQVQRYHKQMKMTRVFLEVLAAEKEKMSLNVLGSSTIQADKLHALLQTMEQKKTIMEELLHLSSQLSVHLSEAESSGALLAQLGDVEEEWRVLEGSIKRALRHATNSTSQSSLLIKEAEQLKAKIKALQSNDSKSTLEFICLTTDLKLYSQLYLHLQSQSDALVHFSLGQKERDKIQSNLKELGSLLNDTKRKLDTSSYGCGGISSTKINKQLQDMITWAKQAENHISIGNKLALFPEEARIQIIDMKKFQTDILSRRAKMQAQVEAMKAVSFDLEKEESDQVLKTLEDLYEAIVNSLDHVLDTMKKQLQKREKLLSHLTSTDVWLAATHATRDPCAHVENMSKADIQELESKLESHKSATVEIQSQLNLVEAMAESCKDMTVGLSPGESRYLVNRLSGLWTELDGLLAHERATSWELEELIQERTSSDEELSTIEASLNQISADLEKQKFPLTQETLSTVATLKHMLMETQCQVQELQHCHEAKRSALLYTIGELQDRCKALTLNAFEQDKYLHLRRQMEESRDIAKEQIQRVKDKTLSLGERFRLCQTLLVELPLLKTQCQEAGDQLEAIAQEMYPSELNTEKQRIRLTVETLVSWEQSVTDDIKYLETQLLLGLHFSSELPALIELFQNTRLELEGARPVDPDEKAIDSALRRYWVVWRNMESGMRVLEALGRREKVNLKNHIELCSLRDAAMQECHLRMESLSQARESLKDYQWAAQGAISFLHNAEATFLSAPGGFLDCTEEQRQTQQALEDLEEGFQAHICHLAELVPQRPCLSRPKAEQLHIGILSQLLVGRALLEAQAQLRLESLQSCAIRQQSHRSCHEDIRQRLSVSEARLAECAAAQVTSYDKCVVHQKRSMLLIEDLRNLARKIEELRAGCPMQGCGVGKDGELATLWRRWVSLRRGVGVLMAHAEQRQEEWKDITTSIEQCCSFLASLQAEVPDSSTVSFTQEKPQELLDQAEMHQAGLEQEQQALASLEHRLEHALSLSSSPDPTSPGPVGRTLVKIQENVRSLKERNLQVVAAAQAEEKERQQVQEEIGEVEKHMLAILPTLEACSDRSKRQELRKDLSSQRSKLNSITDGVQSRYDEIPIDIQNWLQEVQLSLQRAEEKLMEMSGPAQELTAQVEELCTGLKKLNTSLEQKSPTVSDAQKVLKHVWDELDTWHSRLMLLESEVQDLAEEQPEQAHLLMDQLTQPLQLHQNASQLAEQRTAFLSKIPVCLQELKDILDSATCWMNEAKSWLSTPCSFTTARSLQSHANSLQLVLDDSERIRDTLHGFRPVLAEISDICDISKQEEQLDQNDQQVLKMQRHLLEPLQQLLQAAVLVEAMEDELKTMEKNVPKIRTILSCMDDTNISLMEHLNNRQVILANVQSMQKTLEDMERCKEELDLPRAAEESLLVFSRAKLLLPQLEEVERLTQEQASLLERKIRLEEETMKDLSVSTVSSIPEETQQLYRGHLVQQEAFEVSNSEEEEEEEDDESSHSSSSSDTLTCSIPEDPDEPLISEDFAEMEPLSKVQEPGSLAHQFPSEVETSSGAAESGLLSVKPACDTNDSGSKNVETGFITMDSKAGVGGSSCPVTLGAEPLISAVIPAATHQFTAATKLPQPAAAVEDTRLIPTRPTAPFMPQRESVFTEEEEEEEEEEGEDRDGGRHHDKDEKEQQRWSRLYTQICQKLTTLRKVQQEHQTLISSSEDGGSQEKVPEKESISTGSVSAILQRMHESITMLRQMVKSADSSHPGVKEELYEAARRVLLCLDSWTDLLVTPGGAGEDDPQLSLLQQECASKELVTLVEMLNKVESDTRPELSKEQPDAYRCLTCLQDCLCSVQLLFTSSNKQLTQHLAPKDHQHQELVKQLCILDDFEPGQSETFPILKDAPSLEQCILGQHVRERPGEKAKLQQASRSLLQGITHLLELGEEGIKERQMSQVHNRSQLQAVLGRHKRLLQVLGSQLAFVHHLFQREPEVLRCQEDERLQLEVRAKALQQQALEQEVASQRKLQEWSLWEDSCGQLGRVLDESEAFISSGEPEGEDEEESVIQRRLDACKQMLVQLDESRAALGQLLDQRTVLQTEPSFAASVSQTGGALELRWRSAFRRTEQEIQRCRNIQDVQARFQTDFTLISNWLVGANKHLKTWSDLANTTDLNQQCVHNSLIELLDFSMEVQATSVQKASVSREATQLLHLREADCPGLRAQISQLEVGWSRLTSDQSRIQEQLHQRLLATWPPAELLSDLENWLKKLEARLSQDEESLLKAKDAAQVTEVLQHYKELKAGIVSGQLLLDFLCQSGPQAMGADVQSLRSERSMFAETLGALRLQWLHVQRRLESQIHRAEQMHHTCAARERRLRHLHGWIERQKKQLSQWEQPTSQTLARKTLQEWEAVVGRVKKAAAALQELKTIRAQAEKEEEHPCDIAFSNQAESVRHVCQDLSQQMEALKPALQQTVAERSYFDRDLREVTLITRRVRCALQHQGAPLFSLEQAEGHVELLQKLQEDAGKGEDLWTAVEKSHKSLMKTLDRGAAQLLGEQMEGERARWRDMVQELKDEHMKTRETIRLWQEYSRLSESCSHHLQQLWLQWEELTSSISSSEQDTHTMVESVEKLQVVAEGLQSSVGDVLEASKPLIGRLGPPVTNLIQSETRLLSRDVLLLCQAMSGKKKSLQDDVDEQKHFRISLQTLEKQTENLQHKLKAGANDKDSVKQFLLELSNLLPSLIEVRETSGCLTLSSHETERLHRLSRQWIESMTHTSDVNRELQAEHQCSQTFEQRCKNLTRLQEKLVEESTSKKPQSLSCLQEMLAVHQRLQAEITSGHQLLHALLCDAVKSMEKETGQKRSELMAQVTRMKESWLGAVALVAQRSSLVKEQLGQRRIYRHGLKRLWRLLRDVDPLLPPAGPALCTVQRLTSCVDDFQCVEEALGLHSTVYTQTLEAGTCLCEAMTEPECQGGLQSELQAVEEAWQRTTSLLSSRRDLVHTTVQKWSQCQDEMNNIMSELDEVKTRMKQQLPERPEEEIVQETELSLQRLASGLRELGTMKTDLSQYITAGDSALLEQQLEQLHGQWEELCMKVSLRRQEIADRLNAWTIFNDKNKEFCDWLTQMENKVCHSGDLSIEEMVEKLKKDCMEEINLFSENKSHLKQLGEQLLLASDEAKQTQVRGSMQEVNQRWHNLFHHIEARVKKLKETLVTMQQLDKNMSNLRSWLSRIEAELSRPITYSVCHHQEIQRRLAEQQELQRDIEQHTEGVASVLNLCDVLLRDEDAAGGTEAESDSLQETSRSLDQRWRTICAMALERRLRIEETWRLWCKFLDDYSRFEDWLKMAERTAANPNSADVLYTVAKEELKKFEGFQRQVHERLTQLELVNNQYRRLARENRTDRASQLKAMVHEGNRRWDTLHRRVAAVLRRLKYFTSQREDFEGTRESMLVWLTELDLQLTNVEHFSESDVHHKIQQLNSFQKEITLNTERIDGLIVFGESLIQKSSPQDAALIEDELEELHTYCQDVFSRLVRFHQRLSQPPTARKEPELSTTSFSLESSLELIGRPWLGRSQGSLPATPTHLLMSPLERSGRETPVSVDSLPLEWDHTGDVGGSSTHEDDDDEEEEEEHDEEGTYFSALSEVEITERLEDFIEAPEALLSCSLGPGKSRLGRESPGWKSPADTQGGAQAAHALTSTPIKQGYLGLMSQCSGSIKDFKRVSLILDNEEEEPKELGLTGLSASDKQSGVIERWELIQAQSRSEQQAGPPQPKQLTSDLHDITSWLEDVIPELERLQTTNPVPSIEDMETKAKELKEMQRTFTHYKSIMLSINLRAQEAPELQDRLTSMNRDWSRACTGLQQWDASLRKTLLRCQEFHENLHSLLLWLAHADSRRYTVDISDPDTSVWALQQHHNTLTELQEELLGRQAQQASLQALWSQLQPEDGAKETDEAQEKLHVTGSKMRLLLKEVNQDLSALQQRLDSEPASGDRGASADESKTDSPAHRQRRDGSPPRSFFYRVLRAAFPLHLLLLLLLLLPCLIPLSENDPSCTMANNFARSFYPMLRYTNGPPPT